MLSAANVLYRDSYWGQFRAMLNGSGGAAGTAWAAARWGFPLAADPPAGTIMVWPGVYAGASRSGHVGIVEDFLDDGRVLVRSENWPYGSYEHWRAFPVQPRHLFVLSG